MKCKCEVWTVGCEEFNVKCEESVCVAPGSRAGHVLGQQHCNSFAQSTHARAWLAHGACEFLSSSTGK